jgi:hypothetical protein
LINETVFFDTAFQYSTISFDATGSTVYVLAYYAATYEYYENALAIHADTLSVRWLTQTKDDEPYGSTILDIGNAELMVGTDLSIQKLRASDGFSLAYNETISTRRSLPPTPSVYWGTESPFIYNPVQRRGLHMCLLERRSIYGFRPDNFGHAEWILNGNTAVQLGAGTGQSWDFSNPVAVDGAGRIFVVETGVGLWVFGSYSPAAEFFSLLLSKRF